LQSDLMAARLEAARCEPPSLETPIRQSISTSGRCSSGSDRDASPLVGQPSGRAPCQDPGNQAAESQKEAERETIRATINKFGETIPLLQDKVNVRKYLTDRELGSKLVYLTDLQELVGQQQDLLVQKSLTAKPARRSAALVETRIRATAEFQRTLLDDLVKAEQKGSGLAQDVIKAEQRTRLQYLTAPVDGVVQQLAIHTIGGVVTPAQALAVIVPQESHLEIDAMIPNRDIGFVEAGQEAAIKIDTFQFHAQTDCMRRQSDCSPR